MSISSLQSHLYSTGSRKWTTSMDNYPGNAFGRNIKIRFHSKSDSKLNFSKVLSLNKADHHSPFSPVQCLSGSVHEQNHKCKPITNQIQLGNSSLLSTILKTIDAFVRFTRPHTIIGTIIGITSVSLLPVESFSDLKLSFFIGLIKMIVPAVLMNIYIVGLNEIYDVEIDKINKPTLPLASGEFTMGVGIALVTASFILSFITGFQSPPLLLALLISCILGTIYSIDLPLLRWKQYPLLAASCILFVRAFLLQLAFFAHTQKYILGKPFMINKPSMFGTSFMCCFVAVIALFKDIPDIEGDKNFGIQSFSVQLGAEKVFWLCIKILLTAYTIAMMLGATAPNLYLKFITVIGHGLLALLLLYGAKSVDVKSSASMYSFYMFIWKLFYAEYFLIPFVR